MTDRARPAQIYVARTLARLALTENLSLLQGADLLIRRSETYTADEVKAGLRYARERLDARGIPDVEMGASPWLACSTLLDAAERIVSDLRLEHGCEDWHAADWSQAAVQDTALLHDTCAELRRRARALRDEALVLATYHARKAG